MSIVRTGEPTRICVLFSVPREKFENARMQRHFEFVDGTGGVDSACF